MWEGWEKGWEVDSKLEICFSDVPECHGESKRTSPSDLLELHIQTKHTRTYEHLHPLYRCTPAREYVCVECVCI